MSYIYSPTVHVAEPQSCSLKRHPLLILINLIDKWANGDRLRSYQPCPSLSALCIHLLLETTLSLSRSLLPMYLYKLLFNNTVVKSVDCGLGLRQRLRSKCTQLGVQRIMMMIVPQRYKARWPSGLRRQTKALIEHCNLVRKGVGSNPTLVSSFSFLTEAPQEDI